MVLIAASTIGGIVPDAIEKLGPIRISRHRTYTHWLLAWIVISVVHFAFWQPRLESYIATGLLAGIFTHLAFDVITPMGIPLLVPWKRHTLKLWKSGQKDYLLYTSYFLAVLISTIILHA